MHLVRKTRRITMLVGAGAAAAYFLDPDNGAARREHLLEQVRELSRGKGPLGKGAAPLPFVPPTVDDPVDEMVDLPPLGSTESAREPDRWLAQEALSGRHSDAP